AARLLAFMRPRCSLDPSRPVLQQPRFSAFLLTSLRRDRALGRRDAQRGRGHRLADHRSRRATVAVLGHKCLRDALVEPFILDRLDHHRHCLTPHHECHPAVGPCPAVPRASAPPTPPHLPPPTPPPAPTP